MQRRASIIAISLSTACAMYSASSYSGDGRLLDHGFMATPRYTLDLGSIELSRTGSYSYQLDSLPPVEFTVGIQLEEPKSIQASFDRPSPNARVKLTVESPSKQIVISEQVPPDKWDLSFGRDQPQSFLYRRGAEKEIPLAAGGIQLERVETKVDGGWGTYFTPARPRNTASLWKFLREHQCTIALPG